MANPESTEKRHTRPVWVTVAGIVAILVLVVVVVMALTGGNHGPGRHLPGGDNDAPAEHSPPPGGHD